MAPPREQLIANIKAMESQGAKQPEIQKYLDQFKGQQPVNTLSVDQTQLALATVSNASTTGLSHANNLISNILSTGGAIAGGFGGAALGGLAGLETGPGAALTGYAGEVAGTALGAAGGEALGELIETKLGQRKNVDTQNITKTGVEFGALEAIGGPIFSAGGKLLKGAGKTIAEAVIPTSMKEAGQELSYKAANPLWGRLAGLFGKKVADAPATAASTAFEKGLMGTEKGIGIRAKRLSSALWTNLVSPALEKSPVKLDMPSFFEEAATNIIKNTPEIGDQNARLSALKAIGEEYAEKPTATMKELQNYKRGWASHVPEKYYKGENITQTYNNVRAELASLARTKIYDAIGKEAKQAYFDYGNLEALKELGQKSMTGGKLKGGFGSFWSAIKDMALVPVGTVGGQTIYKVGQLAEFVGKPGSRYVRDLFPMIGQAAQTDNSVPQ